MLASCGEEPGGPEVEMPATPVIVLRPTWAVVTEAYVRLRAGPEGGAPISGHLRRGDVAEITAINPAAEQVDGERRHWYELRNEQASGWVTEDTLEAYSSEYRARHASAQLGTGE